MKTKRGKGHLAVTVICSDPPWAPQPPTAAVSTPPVHPTPGFQVLLDNSLTGKILRPPGK